MGTPFASGPVWVCRFSFYFIAFQATLYTIRSATYRISFHVWRCLLFAAQAR